ncbi:MAG: cysteine hydrolase [Actinomycetota bacterium]|nr:cysteine hydrolase [Actinomycetota bacterium]
MHTSSIPDDLRLAVVERRGRAHAHEGYDPQTIALVVVDMQNHFVAEGGLSEVPAARGIVSNINNLVDAFRRAGGVVVWVRSTMSLEGRGSWPMFFDNFIAPERSRDARAGLIADTWGHEFFENLDVGPDEVIVDKDRFSPFSPGASNLDETLKRLGVDTVFVTGTMTNVCCDSTARDAMMLDYRSVMIEDANAARTDEAHVGALSTFMSVFGDVITTREAIELLEGS